MRNIRILVGLIVISIGVVGVFLTWDNYTETRNSQFEYIVENDHVNTIYVKDRIASIEVLPATGNDIIISWEEDTNRKKDHVTIEERGNQLEIKRQSKGSMIMIPTFNMRQKNMKVYIPAERMLSININNAVGSILVHDVQVDDLKIQADVHKIVVENVEAKNIRARSSVGSIVIENSTGDLTASSNVGSVEVDVAEVLGNMDLRSDVGSVKLSIDEQPDNVSFSGTSEIGSVRIFGERTSIPVDHAAYKVYLQTDVGSVEVLARK